MLASYSTTQKFFFWFSVLFLLLAFLPTSLLGTLFFIVLFIFSFLLLIAGEFIRPAFRKRRQLQIRT